MSDKYETVARYPSEVEAELARLNLASEDIPAFLLDENTTRLYTFSGMAIGVRVQVPVEYASKAKDILAATAPVDSATFDAVEQAGGFNPDQLEAEFRSMAPERRGLWRNPTLSILQLLLLSLTLFLIFSLLNN